MLKRMTYSVGDALTRIEDVQETWAAFRDACFRMLHVFVGITFLYVGFQVVPRLTGASEAIAGMPRLNFAILMVHVFAAMPPLLIGLIAFNPKLRRRNLGQHRDLGRLYCYCIWISAVTGIALATANTAGIGARLGFGILGVVWFWTTWQAYRTGREKRIPEHRVWMIRSYATTLAVVTVRPLFWFGPLPGFDGAEWVVFSSWACWVPNLMLAEFYIRITTFGGKLKLPAPARAAAQ